jgi:hypothetical protein
MIYLRSLGIFYAVKAWVILKSERKLWQETG